MDLSTFIVAVFCLIDDRIKDLGRLRGRGPTPTLCDSEVLTIEVVGEFLGIDEDTELFAYFRRHYAHFFPNLRQVHRTTFTRQAANLWKLKEILWQELLAESPHEPTTPPSRFATRCPCLCACSLALSAAGASMERPLSARTRCSRCSSRPSLRLPGAHEGLCWPGLISRISVAPARAPTSSRWSRRSSRGPRVSSSENTQLPLAQDYRGVGGDGHRAPGSLLLQEARSRSSKECPACSRFRYRIDTVFSQLSGRYSIKRVWARELWHLTSRLVAQSPLSYRGFPAQPSERQPTPAAGEAPLLKPAHRVS